LLCIMLLEFKNHLPPTPHKLSPKLPRFRGVDSVFEST
jgi:hypothetical protein